MLNTMFSELSVYMKFVFLLFFSIASATITFFIGLLIAIPIFDMKIIELNSYFDINNNINIPLIKYFQIIYSIGIFILPAIIAKYAFSKNQANAIEFGLRRNISVNSVFLTIICILSAIPLINILAEINSMLKLPSFFSGIESWMRNSEKNAQELTEMFLSVNSLWGLLLNLFMMALLPAIGEEFLFRGVVQKLFIQWTRNNFLSILLTSIIFSALHLQFFGFLPRLALGLLFGYLMVWSKSLWLPMIAHFTNNGFAIIVYYLMGLGKITSDVEKIGTTRETAFFVISSLIVVSAIIYFLYREEKKKTDDINSFQSSI
jgi:membrane protease YdiL (CAAX protease family)